MTAPEIPIHLRRFIEQHIGSVAQLELLLLLRTTPDRWWTPENTAQEMRYEIDWTQREMRNLCDRGFLANSGEGAIQYRYQPRTPDLERAVTEVAQAYLLHRVRLVEIIYQQPSEQIRAFADAFKLRKETDRG